MIHTDDKKEDAGVL